MEEEPVATPTDIPGTVDTPSSVYPTSQPGIVLGDDETCLNMVKNLVEQGNGKVQ